MAKADMSHNRTKQYLLPEGEPVPFLVKLGVMTMEGKVVKAKYDIPPDQPFFGIYRGYLPGAEPEPGDLDDRFWMRKVVSDLCNVLLSA